MISPVSGWEVITDQLSNDNWTVYNGSIKTSHSSRSEHTFNWQIQSDQELSYFLVDGDHYSYRHQTISTASPPISVWDMILCIPDNYFYSPRLSDSLREITLGWLLDTGLGWTQHIGSEEVAYIWNWLTSETWFSCHKSLVLLNPKLRQ